MKTIRIASSLLLGAALMAGCTERNGPTGLTATPTGTLSADVAAGKTSAVSDLAGDAGKDAQDYQDIVGATVTKKGGTFVFVMTLAASVPDNPTLATNWADVAHWGVALDMANTSPAGYPFQKNVARVFDFLIEHRVYRSGFSDPLDATGSAGILIDRRPLRTGGQAIITPVKFSIDGSTITWVVDAGALGDPSTFQWADYTALSHAGDDLKNGGGYNIEILDEAPDVSQGAPRATWPQ